MRSSPGLDQPEQLGLWSDKEDDQDRSKDKWDDSVYPGEKGGGGRDNGCSILHVSVFKKYAGILERNIGI